MNSRDYFLFFNKKVMDVVLPLQASGVSVPNVDDPEAFPALA